MAPHRACTISTPCVHCAGPLSNLAYALDKRSEAAAKVARVWWMGGALQVPGNVYEPQSDGSAEWNAFWVGGRRLTLAFHPCM